MLVPAALLFFFGMPFVLRYATERWPWLDHLGLVTLCYIIGIIAGNLFLPASLSDLTQHVVEITVPLSIPLLLFVTDFGVFKDRGKHILIAFGLAVVAVICAVTTMLIISGDNLEHAWKVGSMLIGIFTGGTPNMSAIGVALEVEPAMFAVVNGTEMLFGGAWLLFLLSLGKRAYGLLFRDKHDIDLVPDPDHRNVPEENPLDEKLYGFYGLIPLVCALFVLGAAVGISWLFTGGMSEVLILFVITSLGIGASLVPKLRNLKGAFGVGNYLLLVFCVAVGSLAKVSEIVGAAPVVLTFVGGVMAISIALHAIFCRIFNLDRDTVIMASAAGLYGPPFIAPIAKAIKRPELISIGIAVALLGFAIGNYCGIGLSGVFKMLVS